MSLEERRKKEEKQIMIEGTIIALIIIFALGVALKIFIFDNEFSSDIYICRREGQTTEERAENGQTYYVNIGRKKIIKGKDKVVTEGSSGTTKTVFKKTSEKKLTDEELNKIIEYTKQPTTAIAGKTNMNAYYFIEYQNHFTMVYDEDLQYIDNLVKDMD